MSSKPILYMHPASPPARAVMMLIDILGIDVEYQILNAIQREQDAPEFLKKNPMKTIPIFVDGDYSIADSHAIMIYLMDKYGKSQHSELFPIDRRKRATVIQRLFFDCGILFQRLRSIMSPTYTFKLAEVSKSMIRNTNDAYGMLEMYLSDTKYVADDVMTIADLSIISTIGSLSGMIPVDGDKYPKLKQWLRIMNEKDFCKRINTPGSEEHVAGLKALMEHTKNLKSKL